MSKKAKHEPTTEVGLDVNYSSYTEVTQEARTDDPHDRDDTSTSHEVRELILKDTYPDVTACFPVAVGDVLYLVYLVYSTADSFGRDEHKYINFVDVFLTKEKADAAAAAIQEHADWFKKRNRHWEPLTKQQRKELDKKYKDEYTVTFIRENGNEEELHAGWNGYFESLSYINVESFPVKAKTTIKGW